MSDETKTQSALMQAAKDFLTAGNVPVIGEGDVAWENRNFDPEGKPLWASVKYVPNQPVARTIGVNGIDELTGFIQIDFNVPSNSGDSELRKWENKGRAFFTAGNRFTFGGHSVLATSVGISQGRVVDNHYRKSLTVAFKSQLKRQNLTT